MILRRGASESKLHSEKSPAPSYRRRFTRQVSMGRSLVGKPKAASGAPTGKDASGWRKVMKLGGGLLHKRSSMDQKLPSSQWTKIRRSMKKKGSTAEVHVAMNLIGLSSISTVDNLFECDFFLFLHWEESTQNVEEIREYETKLEDGDIDVEAFEALWCRLFKPSIEFGNAQSVEIIQPDNSVIRR